MEKISKRRKVAKDVPLTVRELFLGWLNPKDVGRWRSTCRRFCQDKAAFEKVSFRKNFNVNMCVPAQVRTVVMNKSAVVGPCTSLFHNLTAMHLLSINATADVMALVARCAQLQDLRLFLCSNLTDAGVGHFVRLKQLTRLVIGGAVKITNASLVHLGQLSALRFLTLDRCHQISSTERLHKIQHLEMLGLDMARVTNDGLASLNGHKNLRELSLVACTPVSSLERARVRELVNLECLNLRHCSQITDGCMDFLPPKLQKLDLTDCREISDDGLRRLLPLCSLTSLWITNANVTVAGLAHVARLPNLQSLFVELLGPAAKMVLPPRLRTLSLICEQLTDEDLLKVVALTDLEELRLYGCREITNGGVVRLNRLRNLRTFVVSNCRRVMIDGWRVCFASESIEIRY